jgi:SH3-like domain-containing protein
MPWPLTLLVMTTAFLLVTVSPTTHSASAVSEGASSQTDLPRFVSLRADRANARVGPSTIYPIAWTFVRPAIPLEIIQQYGNWRRVRDWQGAEGWVHRALLSNDRAGVVAPWRDKDDHVLLHARAADSAPVSASLQPGVLVRPIDCTGRWCLVKIPEEDIEGYVLQDMVWGVYAGELVQ